MKISLFRTFVLFFTAFLIVSCQEKIAPETETFTMEIGASLENMRDSSEVEDSKITLIKVGEKDLCTKFTEGDKITVYYQTESGTPGKDAAATCVRVNGGIATFSVKFKEGAKLDELYAAYHPHTSDGNAFTENDGRYTSRIKIDNVQTAVRNGFDPETVPMVARYDGSKFNFKNACGIIKFTLNNKCSDEEVEQLHFRSSATQGGNVIPTVIYCWFDREQQDSIINKGSIYVDAKSYDFYKYHALVLRGDNNGVFSTGKNTYYISALPLGGGGFGKPKLSFYTKSGKRVTFSYSRPLDLKITRNNIIDIGEITLDNSTFAAKPSFELKSAGFGREVNMQSVTHGEWTAKMFNKDGVFKDISKAGNGYQNFNIATPVWSKGEITYYARIFTPEMTEPSSFLDCKVDVGVESGAEMDETSFDNFLGSSPDPKVTGNVGTSYDINCFLLTKERSVSKGTTSTDHYSYLTGVSVSFISRAKGNAKISFEYLRQYGAPWVIYKNDKICTYPIGENKNGSIQNESVPIGDVSEGDKIEIKGASGSDNLWLGHFTWTVTPTQ